ncbi:family 1 glycosylhydrolase [Alteribacter keqinensis]|uniref:family 1 glycosylhydrolase n=1 Tax=Alteribacter keqinensis TaxID=2483800 RepID=UPI00160673A0|nr:family 1 glycosylhydrolase [Alteribacter keqinensis]
MKLPFLWAVGIENTFVTQVERGERPLDEYELTQHYRYWKEDLDRAKNLGVTMIRYGIPWHKVEPEENVFDWSWVDQVMNYFRESSVLIPVIDLMHYGTPHWLKNEFSNGGYPEYVARYARAFAERYGSFIKYYTPLNEPYVNAEFCGLNGVWPPYQTGLGGFYSLVIQLGKGIVHTVNAVRDVVPDAIFIHVDATKHYFTYDPLLQGEAELWNENSMVMWELLRGRIDKSHMLYPLMTRYGTAPSSLEWFQHNPIDFDMIGVNYYPQFSVHEVKRDEKGFVIYPHVLGGGRELKSIISTFHKRYNRPVMITETSFRGSENERISWLEECYAASCGMVREGIPLRGLTWFPFMDLVDWGYRTSGKPVEEELLPFGLYDLRMENGVLKRRKNRVAAAFERLINNTKKGAGSHLDFNGSCSLTSS